MLLDPILEDTVRRAITRTAGGRVPHARAAGGAGRRSPPCARPSTTPGGHARRPRAAVILTQPDIRRFVRKLIETELPDVWVVSFAELLPEVALKPVARAIPLAS